MNETDNLSYKGKEHYVKRMCVGQLMVTMSSQPWDAPVYIEIPHEPHESTEYNIVPVDRVGFIGHNEIVISSCAITSDNDRQKCLEALKQKWIPLSEKENKMHQEHINSKAEQRTKVIADGMGQDRWISVRDSLPDYDMQVLVTSEYMPDEIWFAHRTGRKGIVKDGNDFAIYVGAPQITHWQNVEPISNVKK